MKSCSRQTLRGFIGAIAMLAGAVLQAKAKAAPVETLAREVRPLGTIVFGARSKAGDWDLFLMRPDGSGRRNITNTPRFNEGLARFSPDGSRLLYRRLPASENFDNNRHGAQGELVLARSDGSSPRVLAPAGGLPWASWSPDGKRIATLDPAGIHLIELATLREQKLLPRHGFFQQLTWSPDGKWLVGVNNSLGASWMVARMNLESGAVNAVSVHDCCTPDWFPGGRKIVFSGRPGQWTQLWRANGDGSERKLLYAEEGRHVYGGKLSPDGRFVLFTGDAQEDGHPGEGGAPMGIMRLRDSPLMGPKSESLLKQYPQAKRGPVLELPTGWEPDWTRKIVAGAGVQ